MKVFLKFLSIGFVLLTHSTNCLAQSVNSNHNKNESNSLQLSSQKPHLKKSPLHLDELTDDQFLERIQYDYTKLCLLSKDSIVTVEVDGYIINLLPVAVKNKWIDRTQAALEVLDYLYAFERAKTIKGFFPRSFSRQTGEKAAINYWTFGQPYDVYGTAVIAASLQHLIAPFFDKRTKEEFEIRRLCATITNRIDWNFAYNEAKGCFTWFKNGDSAERFDGKDLLGIWDETFFIQLVALSDSKWNHGMSAYQHFTNQLKTDTAFGYRFYPTAQLGYAAQTFLWYDLRKLEDAATKRNGLNYFQSVKNAVKIQMAYASRNPKKYPYYGNIWGIGEMHNDNGDIQLEEVFAAMLFEPDAAIKCLRTIYSIFRLQNIYTSAGMHGIVNVSTGAVKPLSKSQSWFGFYLPLNVLYIENFRSGLLWKLSNKSSGNILNKPNFSNNLFY